MKDTIIKQIGNINTIIQVVFIILKLTNLIQWSWLWVMSPLWIPGIPLLALVFILIMLKLSIKLRSK
jgi:hypothetical protein